MRRKKTGVHSAPTAGAGNGMTAFKFYLAKSANASDQALANLNRICQQYYRGHYAIEKIDILREPQRALGDGVLLTPTLVRITPQPVRITVGDLSHTETVLNALGLYTSPAIGNPA